MSQSFLSVGIHVIGPIKHEVAHFAACFSRRLLGCWAQPFIKTNLVLQRVEASLDCRTAPLSVGHRPRVPPAAAQMCANCLQSKWRHVENMADRNRLRDSAPFVYLSMVFLTTLSAGSIYEYIESTGGIISE